MKHEDHTPEVEPELDPELQAEFGDFLETFRRLESPQPDDRLAAALRARILRRRRYMDPFEPRGIRERVAYYAHGLVYVLRRSMGARILFAILLISFTLFVGIPVTNYLLYPESESIKTAPLELAKVTPKVQEALPGATTNFHTWVRAENDLSRLRAVFEERKRENLKERLQNIGGGDRRKLERIEALSDEVAEDLAGWEDAGQGLNRYRRIEALSLGIRALLGYGSNSVLGRHAQELQKAVGRLEGMLPSLHGPELATALAAYLEAVLVDGGEVRMARLGSELKRFVSEQVYLLGEDQRRARQVHEWRQWQKDREQARREGRSFDRPEPKSAARLAGMHSLAHDSTGVGALADAGLLLRVAPALGVSTLDVSRVRLVFLETLFKRGRRPGSAGASARAALLFAYPDLLGGRRNEILASLKSYRLHPMIFEEDFRAVHFLAWGIFPVGAGWARVNRSLRSLAANSKPEEPVGRAALLLTQLLYTAPSLESRD
jgi:hypothetical protein